MLLELWRWLVGTPSPDRTDVLIETLIESQQRTQQAMLAAIAQISEASAKQGEVLSQYLKLFSDTSEAKGWTHPENDPEDNARELAEMGFPADAEESIQAKWVLDHLDQL